MGKAIRGSCVASGDRLRKDKEILKSEEDGAGKKKNKTLLDCVKCFIQLFLELGKRTSVEEKCSNSHQVRKLGIDPIKLATIVLVFGDQNSMSRQGLMSKHW